jgi:hypothetical protein
MELLVFKKGATKKKGGRFVIFGLSSYLASLIFPKVRAPNYHQLQYIRIDPVIGKCALVH